MIVAIFTTADDLAAANACRNWCEDHGHESHIVTDAQMGFHDRRERGLMGAEMARRMAATMLDIAQGGVVARIDADTRVLAGGFKWLAGATYTEARGYLEGYAKRCSPFAAHADHLARITDLLARSRGGACSGCTITFALSLPECGGSIARRRGIIRWDNATARDVAENPDRRIAEEAEIVALEPMLLPSERKSAMQSLWNNRP